MLLIASCCLTMKAQVFRQVNTEKLANSEPGDCRLAGISPDGSYVLTTTQTNRGLRRTDLKTGVTKQLTDTQGAGFKPHITADGRRVICRKVTFDERHLRQTALQVIDLEKGTEKTFKAPARVIRGYEDEADTKSDPKRAEVFIEDMQLMVTKDGVTTNISPNGTDEDTRYIWPSLSPNGQKILYYVSGEGAYVCNLEGKDVHFIGHDCRAPQWYDDNTIIGMNDRDDGKLLLSSSIMAYTLEGKVQELTDSSMMLQYPQCCAQQGIIVCSAANGELYVIRTK